MVVLGLTGGIAMGKSTVAAIFRSLDVPVWDADAEVHRLFRPGGAAVAPVVAAFGEVRDKAGGIDRGLLSRQVLGDPAALARLEAVVHPLVRGGERRFLAFWRRQGCRLVVLDIPLLFETGAERRLDAVAVVSAPAHLQALRVLRRPGMTPARLAAVRARQMPDRDKRRKADFVLPSGLGRRATVLAVAAVVARLRPPCQTMRSVPDARDRARHRNHRSRA